MRSEVASFGEQIFCWCLLSLSSSCLGGLKNLKMSDVKTDLLVNSADPQNVQDLTQFVQQLLQQMQDRFQNMSDQIITRIDDMGGRIDDLEKNIADLMTQAGVDDSGGL